jgi:hypothetical protein
MEDARPLRQFVLAVPRANDVLHAGVECAFCEACCCYYTPLPITGNHIPTKKRKT